MGPKCFSDPMLFLIQILILISFQTKMFFQLKLVRPQNILNLIWTKFDSPTFLGNLEFGSAQHSLFTKVLSLQGASYLEGQCLQGAFYTEGQILRDAFYIGGQSVQGEFYP